MKLLPTQFGLAIGNAGPNPAVFVLSGGQPFITFVLDPAEAKTYGEALLTSSTGLVVPSSSVPPVAGQMEKI